MYRTIVVASAALILGLAVQGAAAATFAPDAIAADDSLAGSGYAVFGTKWGTPGLGNPGGIVTYSFMATGTSCSAEFFGCTMTALADFMPAGFKSAIVAAFDAWASVADISFMEVSDNGVPFNNPTAVGDIRFGGHTFDGPGGTLAHGYYPPPNGASAAGDIHFDSAETWKMGFGGSGFDIFQVAAHEIGHALGLEHSTAVDSLMYPYYTEAFSGPQADDIAGIQAIYGPKPVMPPTPTIPLPASLPLALAGLALLGVVRRGGQGAAPLTA